MPLGSSSGLLERTYGDSGTAAALTPLSASFSNTAQGFAINTSWTALQVKQEKHQQQVHEQENALRDALCQVANDYAGKKQLTDGALPACSAGNGSVQLASDCDSKELLTSHGLPACHC